MTGNSITDFNKDSPMWVYLGGARGKPGVIYEYHPTRAGDVPKEFLSGYSGYVQTDGYSGYNFIEGSKDIVHIGCWAHARRKFMDVKRAMSNGKTGSADVALRYIRKLYQIESEAAAGEMAPEKIYELRQKKALPVVKEFKGWLDKRKQYTSGGLLGTAMGYTLKQWDNLAENAIRPFVVGRKNWLFSGYPRGAEASAAIYNLIETAKANKLEPYSYLRHLLENLSAADTEEDYMALLPQYIDRDSAILLR